MSTVEERIHQLLVNLERGRWVLQELPDSFVVVNVAGYEALPDLRLEARMDDALPGRQAGRQTPIFRSEMRYLVFNPTWTVPNGILSRDIPAAAPAWRPHRAARQEAEGAGCQWPNGGARLGELVAGARAQLPIHVPAGCGPR
jgi:hypothetical protein